MHSFTIIGTLIYVLSPCKKRVLLVHRTKRESDDQLNFYNGVGGKLEDGETILEGMQRELMEEANIRAIDYQMKGIIHWQGFGKRKENWLGHVFLVTQYEGELFSENIEGSLQFFPLKELENLPLFEGDRLFLPHVFAENRNPFFAFLAYDNKTFLKGRISF